MLYIVTNVINLITCTFSGAFMLSSLIGQVIVSVVTTIFSIILNSISSVLLFFQIVYEDNVFIFTEDLPNITSNVISGCVQLWTTLGNRFVVLCDCVYYQVEATVSSLLWISTASVTMVTEVLYLLKKALIFIGDTLWLLLTFVPVQLPLLLHELFKYVKHLVVTAIIDFYMVLLKVANFLTDVPVQSFVGLISAIVIGRLCINYREDIQSSANSLYWSIVRTCLYLYHSAYHYFVDTDVRVIARMSQGQDLGPHEPEPPVDDDDDTGEALCVVCQERHKCVLILPCRHVCLCRECCTRLYNYQRTCPICRTFIYHSVNIYI